jgi:hypothetical protein
MLFKKFLLSSLCVLSLSSASVFAMQTHSDLDKDRGGNTKLTCQHGLVERAGVALVKDYGPTQIPALRFAVIVGKEVKRSYKTTAGTVLPYTNFFGGNCEINDKTSEFTAVQELYEETGENICLASYALRDGNDVNYYGYVYSGDFSQVNTRGKNYNQLFFYRKDDASVKDIETAMASAATNPNLAHRFKETDKAYAIPLQDILDKARTIHKLETTGQFAQVQNEAHYIFQTRGTGDGTNRTDVYIDPQYMRNIARDITRDPNNLTNICRNISGGCVN